MTEVKVGQVWRSNLTGFEYTIIAIYDSSVSVLKPAGTSLDRSAFDGEIFEMIKEVDPVLSDTPPSDLEIVQKALDETDATMIWTGPYASVVAGSVKVD